VIERLKHLAVHRRHPLFRELIGGGLVIADVNEIERGTTLSNAPRRKIS
jgi:hypothetical protein